MASLRPKRWTAYGRSDSAFGHDDAVNVCFFSMQQQVEVSSLFVGETLIRTIPSFQFTLGIYGATETTLSGEIVSDTAIDVAIWYDKTAPSGTLPPPLPPLYNEEIANDDNRWIWRTQLVRSGLTQTDATQGHLISATHTVPQDALTQTFSRRGPAEENNAPMWAQWWIHPGDHGQDYWTNGLPDGTFGWLSGSMYVRTLIEGPPGA